MRSINKLILISIVFSFALFCFKINANASVLKIDNLSNNVMIAKCNDIFGCDDDPNQPMYWLTLGIDIIKYAAIIALLGLSSLDFIKAIVSNDKDALKKASKTASKRFIYCVIIFFLPLLLEFLLDLFEINK